MNSVMDDSRLLTLPSNERIPLKLHMKMIFDAWRSEDMMFGGMVGWAEVVDVVHQLAHSYQCTRVYCILYIYITVFVKHTSIRM